MRSKLLLNLVTTSAGYYRDKVDWEFASKATANTDLNYNSLDNNFVDIKEEPQPSMEDNPFHTEAGKVVGNKVIHSHRVRVESTKLIVVTFLTIQMRSLLKLYINNLSLLNFTYN